MLDARTYPRASAYLARLPDGLDSFPECQAHVDAHDDLRRFLGRSQLPELPGPFRSFVEGTWKNEWMPEVMGNALLLLARDVAFDSDAAFLAMVEENMDALTRRPLYRMTLRLFSPEQLLGWSERRWGAFHKGTKLVNSEPTQVEGRTEMVLTLSHPPGLYEDLLRANLASVLRTTLVASHAKAPHVAVEVAPDDRQTRFIHSWG